MVCTNVACTDGERLSTSSIVDMVSNVLALRREIKTNEATLSYIVLLPGPLFFLLYEGGKKGSGTLTKDFLSQHSRGLGWVSVK